MQEAPEVSFPSSLFISGQKMPGMALQGLCGKELPLHEPEQPRWVSLSGLCVNNAGFGWKSLEFCVQQPPTLLEPWGKVTAPSGCQSLEKVEDASLDKDVGSVLSDLDQVKYFW